MQEWEADLSEEIIFAIKKMTTEAIKRLTPDELRGFPGFENYTDEQAEETIQTLVNLSLIYFDLFKRHVVEEEERLRNSADKK